MPPKPALIGRCWAIHKPELLKSALLATHLFILNKSGLTDSATLCGRCSARTNSLLLLIKTPCTPDSSPFSGSRWSCIELLLNCFLLLLVALNNREVRRKRRIRIRTRPTRNNYEGKCYRCGSTTHKPSKNKLDRTSKCSSCGKPGHLAKVCLSSPNTSNSPATAKKVKKTDKIEEMNPDSSENWKKKHNSQPHIN